VRTEIEKKNSQNIRDATITFYRALMKNLTGKRSGEMYRIYKQKGSKGRMYQASKAGEYPAKRTGDLARSFRYVIEKERGRVGTDNEYAVQLEYGTKRMAPRKLFRACTRETEKEIQRIMER